MLHTSSVHNQLSSALVHPTKTGNTSYPVFAEQDLIQRQRAKDARRQGVWKTMRSKSVVYNHLL